MFAWLAALPPVLIYLVIGIGAALENFVPPIPADTFVLLGAFLAESGRAHVLTVFVVTWIANIAAAVSVYLLARRYGNAFFATRAGHFLLHPKQMAQVQRFYDRWGVPAIFFSRFLPAFRAVVPVFAGVTHVPVQRMLPPLAIASGLWYGALVYLGAAAQRNWGAIMMFFRSASAWLLGVTLVLSALLAIWWWRSRRRHSGVV